jgi:hypothetical protein
MLYNEILDSFVRSYTKNGEHLYFKPLTYQKDDQKNLKNYFSPDDCTQYQCWNVGM